MKIETSRLILREIKLGDIKKLSSIYNKHENMKFVSSGKSEWTNSEIIDKYNNTNQNYINGIGILAVEVKENRKIIGEAGLFNSFNNFSKLEIGYIIDSIHWNKGYGKEICLGLINYAKNNLNTKSIIARMYVNNENSVKLSEKCGMERIESNFTENHEEFLVYEINV